MRTDYSALPSGYLSPSQVWSYLSCPACYEQAYILHTPHPLSADLLIGSGVHEALARMRSIIVRGAAVGDVTAALDDLVGVGEEKMDGIVSESSILEETGEMLPVEIDLGRKLDSLGDAKGVMTGLVREVLPQVAVYDVAAGIDAYEARVWHLGTPLPEELATIRDDPEDYKAEAMEQTELGIAPVFPFPVKAYLDVLYRSGALKDFKTSGRRGSPDMLAAIQLLMYGWPWHAAGEELRLGWDVGIKTKTPGFATYWANGDGLIRLDQWEYVRMRVLQVADDICAGRFPVNEGGMFHKFEHGIPTGELAVVNVAV